VCVCSSVVIHSGCSTVLYSTVLYASNGWGSNASNACRGGWVTVLVKVILWYMGQINLSSPNFAEDNDDDDDND
jgi:hypothetical protein